MNRAITRSFLVYIHLILAEHANFNYERISERFENFAVNSPVTDLCRDSSDGAYPPQHEYHILLRQGLSCLHLLPL